MTNFESFLELIKRRKKGTEEYAYSASLLLKDIAYALPSSIYTEREIADALRSDLSKEEASFSDSGIRRVLMENILSVIQESEKEKIISFAPQYNKPQFDTIKWPIEPRRIKHLEEWIKEDPVYEIIFLDISKDHIYLDIKENFEDYYKKMHRKRMEAIKKEKNRNKPSHRIYAGPVWDDIEIKLKDPFEIEVFKNKKFIEQIDYIKLRFDTGIKNKKPDRQWQFLILLSLLQGKNEKKATNKEMAESMSEKLGREISVNNCETIKKNLSKKLSKIFGIDDDPFYTYKEHGYYKPKFTLKPIPILRGDGEVYITHKKEFNDEIDYNLPKKGYHKAEY